MSDKSLPLAIGLNVVLPGLGYLYMGKMIVGVAAVFLVVGIYATSPLNALLVVWISMNAIMAIDMVILHRKLEKEAESRSMKKCPQCAELIKKDAKVCRYCGADVGRSF